MEAHVDRSTHTEDGFDNVDLDSCPKSIRIYSRIFVDVIFSVDLPSLRVSKYEPICEQKSTHYRKDDRKSSNPLQLGLDICNEAAVLLFEKPKCCQYVDH